MTAGYRGAKEKKVYGGRSGNAIPNSSVFKKDLNESKVTADLVLSDRLFQTVGAVKLKTLS